MEGLKETICLNSTSTPQLFTDTLSRVSQLYKRKKRDERTRSLHVCVYVCGYVCAGADMDHWHKITFQKFCFV